MKRILITGTAGFVGTSLKDFIEENLRHYDVYGIDICGRASRERYFKGDINNKKFLKNVIEKVSPHYIFHLAGLTRAEDFRKLISSNLITTYNLLDTAFSLENFKARIIIIGSAAEYGQVLPNKMPVKENHALNPVNLYGISKMYQTLLASVYFKKGLEIVIGRIFNISGRATPRSISAGEFSYRISAIEKGHGKSVIETRGLSSERDYVDIQDACSALMAIAEKGRDGNIYNICSGKPYKTKYILDYLVSLSASRGIKIKASPASQPEIKSIVGSNEKIKEHTGWAPAIGIQESLKNTLDYYRQYGLKR